jgi:hypothetical protein
MRFLGEVRDRVDANQSTAGVKQGAAGIAGTYCCVGLYDIRDWLVLVDW